MKDFQLLPLFAIVALFAAAFFFGGADSPTGGDDPGPPDMRQVFAANKDRDEARLHAYAMGAICDSIADVIEFDGSLDSPHYTTGVQLEELRTLTRKYRMRGWSFVGSYPAIAATMEDFLNQKIGKNGGKIDAEARKRWVEAYRQIGKSCKYAAENG